MGKKKRIAAKIFESVDCPETGLDRIIHLKDDDSEVKLIVNIHSPGYKDAVSRNRLKDPDGTVTDLGKKTGSYDLPLGNSDSLNTKVLKISSATVKLTPTTDPVKIIYRFEGVKSSDTLPMCRQKNGDQGDPVFFEAEFEFKI